MVDKKTQRSVQLKNDYLQTVQVLVPISERSGAIATGRFEITENQINKLNFFLLILRWWQSLETRIAGNLHIAVCFGI